jgi:hypothetical protein
MASTPEISPAPQNSLLNDDLISATSPKHKRKRMRLLLPKEIAIEYRIFFQTRPVFLDALPQGTCPVATLRQHAADMFDEGGFFV